MIRTSKFGGVAWQAACPDILTVRECLETGGQVWLRMGSGINSTEIEVMDFPAYLEMLEYEEGLRFSRMIWSLDKELNKHAGSLL